MTIKLSLCHILSYQDICILRTSINATPDGYSYFTHYIIYISYVQNFLTLNENNYCKGE